MEGCLVRPQTAERIAADLVQVIGSPSGTGYEAKIEGISLAGKTGTAELRMSKNTSGKEIGWFVAYDTDKPELLVASAGRAGPRRQRAGAT